MTEAVGKIIEQDTENGSGLEIVPVLISISEVTPRLKILVVGKTGCGKSRLLNILIGAKVFKSAGLGDASCDMKRVTSKIEEKTIVLRNAVITILDSPGLQDMEDKEEETLAEIEKQFANIGLIIFCTSMMESRWANDDKKTLDHFHKRFGNALWNKTVVVLTKANQFEKMRPQPTLFGTFGSNRVKTELDQACETAFKTLSTTFREHLVKHKVPSDIVDQIPIIAAGSDEQREILYVREPTAPNPPKPGSFKQQDFLSELWVTCLERVQTPAGAVSLIDATFHDNVRLSVTALLPSGKVKEIAENIKIVNTGIQELKVECKITREVERIRMAPLKLNDDQTRRLYKTCQKTFTSTQSEKKDERREVVGSSGAAVDGGGDSGDADQDNDVDLLSLPMESIAYMRTGNGLFALALAIVRCSK